MRRSAGSVLLLTVMVIAVLTTTTLGAVAIRFEQLSSTDKINNSAVAKLAADSGLAKLKEKLTAGTPIVPTVYDLDRNEETTSGVDLVTYKPSPRSIVSSFEKASTALPRCLAVAVIAPWVNAGKYLFQEDDSTNPALLFHYANIINDTPLGAIPENDSINNTADKQLPLSELTRMGHFYNPYAPVTEAQGSRLYWTIKMGGPEDEFLTRRNSDGSGSYYNSLDFVYIPYLPRFVDTSIATSGSSQTGLDRINATDYRAKLESVIKSNNFKIWLDSSVKDSVIYDYGLGDLFTEDANYRINWLQPSLWNDLPETDVSLVHKTENVNNTPTDVWSQKAAQLLTTSNGTTGWDVDINRGSRSFGLWRLNTNAGATQFTPGATITALYYGSLDGIRLNQKLSVTLLRRSDRNPLLLQQRTTDQGRLYDVRITEITVAGNTVTMRLTLSSNTYQTPLRADGGVIKWADIDSIVTNGNAQVSTSNSLSNATLTDNGDGVDVTVGANSSCVAGGSLAACPAAGDIVTLTRAGSPKVWGQVKSVRFNGSSIAGFIVDKLRAQPKPLRHQASTTYSAGGSNPLIAYYGGEVVMNDYEGGFSGESDELWLYDPETNNWVYPTQSGSKPGRLAGASMVHDALNGRLVLFGGYYHEPIALTNPPGQIDCQISSATCLNTNQAGLRVAKRLNGDTYAYTLSTGNWEKIAYTIDAAKKIQNGKNYQVRVVSTLADRSGLERWKWTPRADTNGGAKVTLDVSGGATSVVKLTPSTAGIAKGDELYIYSRQPNFNAWARVTAVDYPNDTITILVHGHARSASTVLLDELLIQVLNRQSAAQTCTGAVNGSLYTCALSGDTTGYAVGDQVVLEEYQSGRLEQALTGYISYMTAPGVMSFVVDERLPVLADFRDNGGVGIVPNESAVALPVARYGATMQMKPGDPSSGKQLNYLWQGNAKNIATNIRMSDIWSLEFNQGVTTGEASAIWGSKPKSISNPDPNTANNYNFKVIRTGHQAQIFTPPNGASAPEMVKDKVTVDPRTGNQTIEWDNNKTWDLTIETGGDEAGAPGKLVANAQVVIERESGPDGPNPNVRESFNGVIVSTFTDGYNATVIRVKHNPGYAGDTGLKSHSRNAKISIFSYYRTDVALVSKARWVSAGNYLRLFNLTSDEINRVPSAGVAVMFWRDIGGKHEAYTMTIKNRTYEAGVNEFRLYSDGLPYKGPAPLAYGTNALVSHNGNDAFTLSLADQQLATNGQGAAEWFANARDANPNWEIRISDTDNGAGQINDRPSPRQAGAMGTIYTPGNQKSQVFVVGGTFGRFADLWRMDDAGRMNGADDARWRIGKASPVAAQDLPNLFGGNLNLYEHNGAVKAVAFGGKLKFDSGTGDYNKQIGPRILGEPDVQHYSYPDNAAYLPGDSTTDAAGFTSTLTRNFPNSVSNDVRSTLNSFGLTGAGIPAGYTKTVCTYVGQVCNAGNDSSPLLQHLGTLGRHSANASVYGGGSWGVARAVLNPGSAFRKEGTGANEKPRLIAGLSSMSSGQTNGRWDQDGYYPYRCDSGSGCDVAPYGTALTSYTSDKTLMTAGFATITGATQGGAIFVTTTGVGMAVTTNRGGANDASGRWYSYCAEVDDNFACQNRATRYLGWLPDVEDVVLTFNAALTLSSTDTYRVVGYHGGAKRGYQVIKQPGRDPIVFEIVP